MVSERSLKQCPALRASAVCGADSRRTIAQLVVESLVTVALHQSSLKHEVKSDLNICSFSTSEWNGRFCQVMLVH